MPAETKIQLSTRIKALLDGRSGDANIDTDEARQFFADELANAIEAYVIGRMTNVTGVQPGSGTAIGTIQ